MGDNAHSPRCENIASQTASHSTFLRHADHNGITLCQARLGNIMCSGDMCIVNSYMNDVGSWSVREQLDSLKGVCI